METTTSNLTQKGRHLIFAFAQNILLNLIVLLLAAHFNVYAPYSRRVVLQNKKIHKEIILNIYSQDEGLLKVILLYSRHEIFHHFKQ